MSDQDDAPVTCAWWLQTPSSSSWGNSAELVFGDMTMAFYVTFEDACVRPALWVDKEYLLANQ